MRILEPAAAITALAVVLAGLGVPAGGQVSEVIEVRVVNVDVTVSDRKDRPVAGLERGDFEVRVDGKAVALVNFYAAEPAPGRSAEAARPAADATSAGAGASPDDAGARPLQLAILVDSSNVEARARNEGLEQVRAFLRAQLRPGDRVMVVAVPPVAPEGRPATTFIDRLDLVEQRLGEIAATPTQDRRAAQFREILQDIGASLAASNASVRGRVHSLEARIRAFSAEVSRDTARTAGDLRRLVDYMAGLPGRKAVLYLGGGLSLHPGEALSGALAQAIGRYATQLPVGSRVPDLPSPSADDDSGELRALARHASVSGVAFYAIALGGSASAAAFTLSRGSVEAGAGPAPGQEESWAPMVGVSRRFDRESSLQLLAGATGGRSANDRGTERLLDRLFEDARTFYSLGIQPPEGTSGRVHRLEVRVRRRGLRVRHRESFRVLDRDRQDTPPLAAPSPPADPSINPAVARERRSTAARKRQERRKYRLPEAETAAGYRHALRLLAGGETGAARTALRELEAGAARHAAYDQLGKNEGRILDDLEEVAPDSLLPVALLYLDLVPIYRRLGLGPLAEHALRMSRRLATSVASEGSPAARAAVGRALTELAGVLLRAGRLGECEELFERALEVDVDRQLDDYKTTARLGLGVSHERRGRYEEAVEILEPLAERRPAHPEARLRLALNLARLGKADRSRPLLEALAAAPTDWIAQLAAQESARTALRERRFEEASSILAAALERWPDHPGLQVQQALVLDRRGRSRQARNQVASLVAAGATAEANPRDRYNRWPTSDDARRALREDAGALRAELGRALKKVAP